MYSFIRAFKGQTYRSLDSIQITGNLKLRRIFTTPSPVNEENNESSMSLNLLPKQFYFPSEVQTQRTIIEFLDTVESEKTISQEPIKMPAKIKTAKSMKETTIVENKNFGKIKEMSEKCIEKGYEMERKFLANTNGLEMRRNKNELNTEKVLNSREENKSFKTVATTDRKQSSAKTKLPSKQRISIEKKTVIKEKEVENDKEKPNPWRSIKKAASINRYESATQNPGGVSNFEKGLSKTGGLKSKATNIKSFDANNSSYAELSQKFSTVTETRFFQNVLASAASNQVEESKENHDEIEENIEIEANSFYESSDKKDNKENEQNQKLIYESINDSLDEMQTKIESQKKTKLIENESYFNTSSKFGFGEKMMNKFMEQVQRPYSPPLGERENTEEHEETDNEVEDKEVELIYDPVLNCYYDHKTHTYYELKN